MEIIIGIFITLVLLTAIHGWVSDKSTKIRDDEHNRNLRVSLADRERAFNKRVLEMETELRSRIEYTQEMQVNFTAGLVHGRKWLAKFISESDQKLDEIIIEQMRDKVRPALKAADQVAEARAERRKYKERAKFLEYQLRSLKEYFPFLEEYEDIILDESVEMSAGLNNFVELEKSDPVLQFMPKAEYEKLSTVERNQRALDRYLSGKLNQTTIGRMYERYIGYLYEEKGWTVEYHGILKGYEDLGRDLICRKGDAIRIVQAKCWSQSKTIHEKHIFQLFGTSQLFLIAQQFAELFPTHVGAQLVTSTCLSDVAKQAAERLKVTVKEGLVLDKQYPMIKCNINQKTKEKIYHMPFDQQYDRTKITFANGEFYTLTVAEAENNGFRRAFRYNGGNT